MVTTLGRPAPAESTRDRVAVGQPIRPHATGSRARRLFGGAFVAVGLAEGVWVTLLSFVLPSLAEAEHWSAAWAVLDTAEALSLVGTGWFLLRRDDRCARTAGAAAVLLLTDAWVDINTSAAGAPRSLAVVEACVAEVPLALVCGLLALYVVQRPATFHQENW